MTTTQVRATCPHDCPDTCALLITVEDGVATEVKGDPDHPTTAGVLSLSGHTGAVIEWQQSIDAARWRALQNTSTAQPFALLAEPTRFRALVKNASCAAVYSSTALVYPADAIFSNGFEP